MKSLHLYPIFSLRCTCKHVKWSHDELKWCANGLKRFCNDENSGPFSLLNSVLYQYIRRFTSLSRQQSDIMHYHASKLCLLWVQIVHTNNEMYNHVIVPAVNYGQGQGMSNLYRKPCPFDLALPTTHAPSLSPPSLPHSLPHSLPRSSHQHSLPPARC